MSGDVRRPGDEGKTGTRLHGSSLVNRSGVERATVSESKNPNDSELLFKKETVATHRERERPMPDPNVSY